jgi:hypothetical protein
LFPTVVLQGRGRKEGRERGREGERERKKEGKGSQAHEREGGREGGKEERRTFCNMCQFQESGFWKLGSLGSYQSGFLPYREART